MHYSFFAVATDLVVNFFLEHGKLDDTVFVSCRMFLLLVSKNSSRQHGLFIVAHVIGLFPCAFLFHRHLILFEVWRDYPRVVLEEVVSVLNARLRTVLFVI